jgi:hypothetical protein
MNMSGKNVSRKFSGPGPRADRNDLKRLEAKQRLEAWQSKSLSDQLKELDKLFGVGLGATKQRKRIASLIARASKNPGPSVPKEETKLESQVQKEKLRAKDRRASESK